MNKKGRGQIETLLDELQARRKRTDKQKNDTSKKKIRQETAKDNENENEEVQEQEQDKGYYEVR